MALNACKEEEELLEGRFLTDQIGEASMVGSNEADYQMQVYYDLSTNQARASHLRDAWDLGFSCETNNPNAFINSAMLQSIAPTGKTDFFASYSASDYDFFFENPAQFYEEGILAQDFAQGAAQGEVFIINLGRDLKNQRRGHKLLKFNSFESGVYRFMVADLNQANLQEFEIKSDSRYNNVYVSFAQGDSTLLLEPPKEDWDLLFSRYMTKLFDGSDSLDYSVTGCLLNPYLVEAYQFEAFEQDTTFSWSMVTINEVEYGRLSVRADVIGHDWKSFSLETSSFTINKRNVYFIKDPDEILYRFRFSGFYDQNGNKGNVLFEYLPLN